MLRHRLVAVLPVFDGWVVQTFGFRRFLPVGRPDVAVEFMTQWDVDEIVMLDISATPAGRGPDFNLVSRVARRCFLPLTVGGGVRHLDDIHDLTHAGADKVSINTSAFNEPRLIEQGAEIYGRQCIVTSIDGVRTQDGWAVRSHCGQQSVEKDPVTWARDVERWGAGEILLTSIDRNGSKQGYDVALLRRVADAVTIPIIASGGVGQPDHFVEGIRDGGASAVGAGNYFHFSEHSVITAKAFLAAHGVCVRLDTPATYRGCPIGEDGRVRKRAHFTFDERH